MKDSTIIIAEAGVNHNGSIEMAKKLIDVAADAGVNFVKFQTFDSSKLVTKNAPKALYQNSTLQHAEFQYEMLHSLELTKEMHVELIEYCAVKKIGFLSTAFDIDSLHFLSNLNQKIFKIPSGEITNLQYIRKVADLAKSVILSTGMSTLGEVESAILELENKGLQRSNISVLHCTTEYPAPMSEINLRAMIAMRDCFGVKVGYSDHTLGYEIPIAAVALGASIIEKHFTLDRLLPGPDHKASLEPNELKSMVACIRNVEVALGDGVKRPTISEYKNMVCTRKSLVAKTAIKAGQIFTEKNVTAKRPLGGISADKWDDVIGRTASRDFSIDEKIEF